MREVAVVAGGAGDIGSAVVRRLVGEGCSVAVWDVKPRVGQWASDVYEVRCDISDASQVNAAYRSTEQLLGPITCLINCAGLGQYSGFLGTPEPEWTKIMAVNAIGAANTTRAVLPGMLSQRSGTVVNICSIWSRRFGVNRSAYIASKWALLGLTKCLSEEYGREGIRFVAISPGPVRTAMTRPFLGPDEGNLWLPPEAVGDMVWLAVSPEGGLLMGSEIEMPGLGRPVSRPDDHTP